MIQMVSNNLRIFVNQKNSIFKSLIYNLRLIVVVFKPIYDIF